MSKSFGDPYLGWATFAEDVVVTHETRTGLPEETFPNYDLWENPLTPCMCKAWTRISDWKTQHWLLRSFSYKSSENIYLWDETVNFFCPKRLERTLHGVIKTIKEEKLGHTSNFLRFCHECQIVFHVSSELCKLLEKRERWFSCSDCCSNYSEIEVHIVIDRHHSFSNLAAQPSYCILFILITTCFVPSREGHVLSAHLKYPNISNSWIWI